MVSAIGILGLAYVVGISTERLGGLAGPQVGGILNATFGNIAELIIAFFALSAGKLDVVKASITGSIIGNLLLVLGASMLLGGLRHGHQRFSAKIAGMDATMLVLAVIGLFIPAVFALSPHTQHRAIIGSRRASSSRWCCSCSTSSASSGASSIRRMSSEARSRRGTPDPPGHPRRPSRCWVSRRRSSRCSRSSSSAPSTRSSSSST